MQADEVAGASAYEKPAKIHWRDTFDVWPSVTVKIELMPWHWRFRFYRDGIDPSWRILVGPLTLDVSANKGWFPLEHVGGTCSTCGHAMNTPGCSVGVRDDGSHYPTHTVYGGWASA